ncbi:MAG: phosphoadenylyl-sulfate reductase [Saprospiraceae bacterium]|nr:MAG: phosphoadenylyl-sulfate reductase [Saprospiraceae bacterium]
MITYEENAVQTLAPETLSDQFEAMPFEERIRVLYDIFEEEEVLFTSSFGTNSALLLHLVSRVRPTQKVYFINTRFHFADTLAYKAKLSALLNLQVEEVLPSPHLHELAVHNHLWEKHHDTCCYLNKVLPLEPLKARHKVWISGLMAYQTNQRSRLHIFEGAGLGDKIWKFSPILDMTEEESRQYKLKHQLPPHPLECKGYGSVGCVHCTTKDVGRNGRWKGTGKTECGLHFS